MHTLGLHVEHPGGECLVGSARVAGTEFQMGKAFRQARGHPAGRCAGRGRDRAAALDQDDRTGTREINPENSWNCM
ncbi:MAG: hypothetical protein NTV46_10735 [Verrucomicrobia bacterium]|nr:hypothetical protein [Verrucomicrobiota bacterium]